MGSTFNSSDASPESNSGGNAKTTMPITPTPPASTSNSESEGFQPPKVTVPDVEVERLEPEKGHIPALKSASQQSTDQIDLPEGYVLDEIFGDNGYFKGKTGVEVAAFKDEETGERIIAIGGTNSAEDALTDWPDTGKKQWQEVKGEVESYIGNQSGDAQVTMTGYSLGGGVVQHGMYDLKDPNGSLSGRKVRGVTYDAPGAESSISDYDPNRLKDTEMTHYVVKGSPVSAAGGKHTGGKVLGLEPANPIKNPKNNNPMNLVRAKDNHMLDSIQKSFSNHRTNRKTIEAFDPRPVDYPAEFQNKFGSPQSSLQPSSEPTPYDEMISPDGYSGSGLRGVGSPATKMANNLPDTGNITLDRVARDADGMAGEVVADARMNSGANQKAIDRTKNNISLAVRRVLLDINPDLNPEQRQAIVAERPDLFPQVKLRPQGDTDMDSVFGEISTNIQNERASLGGKANERELIKNHVNRNLHRIKFDEKPESLENLFAQNSQLKRRTQQDFAKQVEVKMPRNPFDVKPKQTPGFGDGLNFEQDVANSQSTLDKLFGRKKWS